MELNKQSVKTTETMIDAEAHASEPYGAFLDTALAETFEEVFGDVRPSAAA